jgi:hypothetical protein
MKKEAYKKAAAIAREEAVLKSQLSELKQTENKVITLVHSDSPEVFKALSESAIKIIETRITKLNKDMEAL